MAGPLFDVLIVGQGLAGTTLAWRLHERGQTLALIDPEAESTASRVAAGLLTPVTGRRFVFSADFAEQFEQSRQFYRELEQTLQTEFFRDVPHVRCFRSAEERELFEDRQRACPLPVEFAAPTPPSLLPDWLAAEHGSFWMGRGGQLNTVAYLDASRAFWKARGCFFRYTLGPHAVEYHPDRVRVPELNLEARRIVFCRGAEDRKHPLFQQLRFLPAQGEILTVTTPGRLEVIGHCGIWLAPFGPGTARVGSTYNSRDLNAGPTEAGRREILTQLQKFVAGDIQVLNHEAGVRPAFDDQQPVCGLHPEMPQIGLFNGLGSKGALLAPGLAAALADHLCRGTSLPEQYDLQRKLAR